jgi:hypothetical protein
MPAALAKSARGKRLRILVIDVGGIRPAGAVNLDQDQN